MRETETMIQKVYILMISKKGHRVMGAFLETYTTDGFVLFFFVSYSSPCFCLL